MNKIIKKALALGVKKKKKLISPGVDVFETDDAVMVYRLTLPPRA